MKQILLCVMLLWLAGCAEGRQGIEWISAEHLKNTETAEKLGDDVLDSWGVWGGLITACGIDKFSVETADAIEQLNNLSAIAPENRTDNERGLALGYWAKVCREITGKTISDVSELVVVFAAFF